MEKSKNKERFQKVNEALAALEHHLELGNKKMDKIMNSEIQARYVLLIWSFEVPFRNPG